MSDEMTPLEAADQIDTTILRESDTPTARAVRVLRDHARATWPVPADPATLSDGTVLGRRTAKSLGIASGEERDDFARYTPPEQP